MSHCARTVLSLTLLGALLLARPSAAAPESGEPIAFDGGLSTGSWPDSVELEVPPAPAGHQPSIALVADHRATDGVVGSGWRLVAGGVLTRHSTTGGAPNHTASDLYRLDGVDLVWVTSPGTAHYQTETWDGSRLSYVTASNTWTRQRDGWTFVYGSAAGTGINATRLLGDAGQTVTRPMGGTCTTNLCKTSGWYLSKVTDPFGNVTKYDYQVPAVPSALAARYPWSSTRTHLLDKITYGTSTVELTYDLRPDSRLAAVNGRAALATHRLRQITSKVGATIYARYALQYEGETTAGVIAAPLTDCDGAPVTADPTFEQSLLQKIVRVGGSVTPQHTVRCLRAHHALTTWQDDASADVLAEIDAPGFGTEPLAEAAVPLAVNLDRDPVTDLIVLGMTSQGAGSIVPNHRAYVATPNQATRFAPAGAAGPGAVAAAWEARLNAVLDGAHLSANRGYAIVDLDGDHEIELVYELAAGTVSADRRAVSGALTFTTVATGLTGCDLRHADFDDVDGDGRTDAIVKAHAAADGCSAQGTTTWIRNTGAAPWLASASARALTLPLENALGPTEWLGLFNSTGVCPNGVVAPTDYNARWSDATDYEADHARLGDLNGDGVLDLAYALYGCWTRTSEDDADTDANETAWEPVAASAYSRVFFGDGNGGWIDSGLSAGPPLTYEFGLLTSSGPDVRRLTAGVLGAVDVDRNGLPELMTTSLGTRGTRVLVSPYHSLTAGFGVTVDPATNVVEPSANDERELTPAGLDNVGRGGPCYERSHAFTLGDFDGDGHADVLTLEFEAEGGAGSALCPAGEWCAVLRTNQRTAVEGRMVTSDGAFGGRTVLTWGFVGEGEHANPNLASNVEVVERIDGAEGAVTLTYSGAFTIDARPSPFAAVVRTNARGGRDELGFVTARWAEGKPSHAARFRPDGSLEHVTAYTYGALGSGGMWMYTAQPYFAPLVRQCDYEVGPPAAGLVQTVTVGALIERCYAYAEGPTLPPGTTDLPGMVQVPIEQVPMALGQTDGQLTPGGGSAYAASFGATAHSFGTISVAQAWAYAPASTQLPAAAAFWRWAVPTALAGAVPDVAAAEAAYAPPLGALPTEVVEFVEDWSYDLAARRLVQSIEHRDTATAGDDRRHDYTFTQVSTSGHWYRLAEERVRDAAGNDLVRTTRGYPSAGSYTPSSETVCGPTAASCRTTTMNVDPATGNLLGRTTPDGVSESWVRGACGLPTSHVDGAGRVRELQYTACRLVRSRFAGGQEDWAYDGVGRVTRATTTPGGGGAVTTIDSYYDDRLTFREDASFLEPRIGRARSDGQLELVYLDGFGRTTKRVVCERGGSTAGQTDVLASVNCKAGPRRTVEWNLYGSDGLRKLEVEPFLTGETPVTHGRAHDGLGRIAVALEPSPSSASPAWVSETTYRGPSWSTVIDPLGRALTHTFTTLESERRVDGQRRSTERFDVQARLIEQLGSDGRAVRRAYTDAGDLQRIWRVDAADCVDASGAVVACTWEHRYTAHDGMGRVLAERDAAGTVTSYTYDGVGRLQTTTLQPVGEPAVVLESRSYTDATATRPATTVVTDEAGVATTITLDGLARPVASDVLDVATAVTWAANGQPATVVDRNGRTTSFVYDPFDRVRRVVGPGGVAVDRTYDGAGRKLGETDADGVTLSHGYTYGGQLATTTRAGRWTEVARSYDAAGRVSTETVDGVRSTLVWDGLDRLTERDEGIDATGQGTVRTRLYYDDGDRVVERTVQPRGGTLARTTHHYDAWGRQVRTTDPAQASWRTELDVLGRTRRTFDPLGHGLGTHYDARGRVVAQERPGGWDYHAYRAGANYTPVTTATALTGLYRHERWDSGDAAGVVARAYTDALGRMVATVEKDGTVREHTWSGDELLTEQWWASASATVALQQRDYLRDAHGWLERVEGPYRPGDAATTIDWVQLAYSAAGRERQRQTPHLTTTFAYDGGLLASESWDDQVRALVRADVAATWVTAEEWRGGGQLRRRDDVRDGLGRVVTSTTTAVGRPTVVVARSGFDAFGQPASETRTVGGVVAATTAWQYDAAGRPRTRTVTPRGGAAMVTDWRWLSNGALEQVTTPSGVTTAYDYGADLLLDRVYDPAVVGAARAVVASRNGRGQITRLEQPVDGTARTFTYDAMGRRDSEGHGPASSLPTLTWARSFDALGRLVTEQHGTAAATWTDAYAYDGRGRLRSETRGPTAEVRRYRWSVGGNLERVERPDGSGWATVMSATYSGQRAITVDGAPISYDPWQHVLADQRGTAFAYDADGEARLITGAGATAVELVRDADGVPVAHLEGGAVARQLAWDLDAAGLPLEVQQSDGVDRTYVSGLGELLGTASGTAFTSGQRGARGELARLGTEALTSGTAFGVGSTAPVGAADERFGFGGLESVAGAPGLLLARHRIYDPATARFLAPDPIGLAGGEHRFAYADGDPVQKVDPLGYAACFAEVGSPPSFVPERLTFRSYEAMSSPVPAPWAEAPSRKHRPRPPGTNDVETICTYFGCTPAPTSSRLDPVGAGSGDVDDDAAEFGAEASPVAEEIVVYADPAKHRRQGSGLPGDLQRSAIRGVLERKLRNARRALADAPSVLGKRIYDDLQSGYELLADPPTWWEVGDATLDAVATGAKTAGDLLLYAVAPGYVAGQGAYEAGAGAVDLAMAEDLATAEAAVDQVMDGTTVVAGVALDVAGVATAGTVAGGRKLVTTAAAEVVAGGADDAARAAVQGSTRVGDISTEELFQYLVADGQEEVMEGFVIDGLKGQVRGTTVFQRDIFLIRAQQKHAVPLRTLASAMEREAADAGARTLRIVGHVVQNEGFMNALVAKRFGYSFTKIDAQTVAFEKALP